VGKREFYALMLCCEKNTTRDYIYLRVCYNSEGVVVVVVGIGWLLGVKVDIINWLCATYNYKLFYTNIISSHALPGFLKNKK